MKKIGVFSGLMVLGLILSYTVFSGGSDTVTNYPSSGTSIVAFGDSLVFGVGATKGNDWVSVLSQQIDLPIINLGHSGDTTKDALLRIDTVLAMDPKVVLMLLGGNDYLRKVPSADTFSNFSTLIESIQASGAIVILLGVRGGVLKDNYADDFEVLVKQHGTAYVPDVLNGLVTHPDLMSDLIHPNDAGYKIMSERIYPVLNELITDGKN